MQRLLFRLSHPSQCLSKEYKFWNSSLLFFAMFLSSVHVSPYNKNRSRGNFACDYGVTAFSHIVCLGAKSLSVSCAFIPAEKHVSFILREDRWMSNASPLNQQLLTTLRDSQQFPGDWTVYLLLECFWNANYFYLWHFGSFDSVTYLEIYFQKILCVTLLSQFLKRNLTTSEFEFLFFFLHLDISVHNLL